jgi:hypothetical protein
MMEFATAGADAEQPLHLSPHAQYNQHGAGSPAFTPFRHSPVDVDSVSQHMPHGFYGDMQRSTFTPSTPSNTTSPRFPGLSPGQQKQTLPHHTPTDRSLPSRDVTEDTIEEAYASFILYCNPSFALSTDTAELIKAFQTMPKSDGKTFKIWDLYDLISKLERGEVKTWTQLALDLGVEPPLTEKGQSTQKVQQYSVRLKVCLSAHRSLSCYGIWSAFFRIFMSISPSPLLMEKAPSALRLNHNISFLNCEIPNCTNVNFHSILICCNLVMIAAHLFQICPKPSASVSKPVSIYRDVIGVQVNLDTVFLIHSSKHPHSTIATNLSPEVDARNACRCIL